MNNLTAALVVKRTPSADAEQVTAADHHHGRRWGTGQQGSLWVRATFRPMPLDRLQDSLVAHPQAATDRGVAEPKLVKDNSSRRDALVGRWQPNLADLHLERQRRGGSNSLRSGPPRVVAKRVARLVLKLSSGAPNRTDGQRKNPIRQPKDVRTGMHYGTSDQPVLQETSQPKQVPGIVS